MYIVYDCDGDMIADNIETLEEAIQLADDVNGWYVEQ